MLLNLSLPSGQSVLNGVGESVTQVKRSGHIGWRNANHEHAPRVMVTNVLPLPVELRETDMVCNKREGKEIEGLDFHALLDQLIMALALTLLQ